MTAVKVEWSIGKILYEQEFCIPGIFLEEDTHNI